MECKFTFVLTEDERFLVTAEIVRGDAGGRQSGFHTTAFTDENLFIYYVVLADLSEEDTTAIISQVLLIAAQRRTPQSWITVHLTDRQFGSLGLDCPPASPALRAPTSMFGFADEDDLEDALMQAPTPICMLAGPDHVFTFVNDAYVRCIGRNTKESVLGKPIREAMLELEGQPFLKLLDDVYRTGKSFVGVEILANLVNEETGKISGVYFDFIYHPVRDEEGQVCGILAQATDVTDRVIEKQVAESREAQLFRQWSELEAIYRKAPLAMCLVDAKKYKILRINEILADMVEQSVEDLMGRYVFDVFPEVPELRDIYSHVIAGETVQNLPITTRPGVRPEDVRHWIVTFSPCYDPFGAVEAIASIALQVPAAPTETSRRLEPAFAMHH